VDRVVLYIEDNLASRMVMAGALGAVSGVELVCAATAAEGLAAAAFRKPTLVLLDANLPDMSGLDVMTQLAALKGKAPVLVVSADVTSEHVGRMLDAGASGYIAKPLDLDELIDTVTRIIH
jgi:DNA-binding response OmpR family regulator